MGKGVQGRFVGERARRVLLGTCARHSLIPGVDAARLHSRAKKSSSLTSVLLRDAKLGDVTSDVHANQAVRDVPRSH